MKRAPWMVLGAIVSFVVAATAQPAAAADPQAAAIRSALSGQPGAGERSHSATDVPRGNLRGDIVNNVRSHPEAPRGGNERPPPPTRPKQNAR